MKTAPKMVETKKLGQFHQTSSVKKKKKKEKRCRLIFIVRKRPNLADPASSGADVGVLLQTAVVLKAVPRCTRRIKPGKVFDFFRPVPVKDKK